MTESWCGALLVTLVPLVTGLNAALIWQVKSLQQQVGGRRFGDGGVGQGSDDG